MFSDCLAVGKSAFQPREKAQSNTKLQDRFIHKDDLQDASGISTSIAGILNSSALQLQDSSQKMIATIAVKHPHLSIKTPQPHIAKRRKAAGVTVMQEMPYSLQAIADAMYNNTTIQQSCHRLHKRAYKQCCKAKHERKSGRKSAWCKSGNWSCSVLLQIPQWHKHIWFWMTLSCVRDGSSCNCKFIEMVAVGICMNSLLTPTTVCNYISAFSSLFAIKSVYIAFAIALRFATAALTLAHEILYKCSSWLASASFCTAAMMLSWTATC